MEINTIIETISEEKFLVLKINKSGSTITLFNKETKETYKYIWHEKTGLYHRKITKNITVDGKTFKFISHKPLHIKII